DRPRRGWSEESTLLKHATWLPFAWVYCAGCTLCALRILQKMTEPDHQRPPRSPRPEGASGNDSPRLHSPMGNEAPSPSLRPPLPPRPPPRPNPFSRPRNPPRCPRLSLTVGAMGLAFDAGATAPSDSGGSTAQDT